MLNIEKVSINDNFFGLGGHSLLATQVVNRIVAKLGVQIALKDLFLTPTITEIAAKIKMSKTQSDKLDEIVNELEKLSPEELTAILNQIE